MNDISINLGDDILIGQDNGISLNEETNLVSSDSVLVGPPGPEGPPGFSPIANVTQTESGATITITDKSGTTSAMVNNGLPGVSPTASVTETASGAVIEITDANGTTTASVNNGNNGADGENASIEIGSVTSLNYGDTPTVTNVGTDTHAILNWGIPAGQQGIQGIQGEPGINAQAYVTQNTGSATITIEDADGITTATVYDGVDGFSPSASVTQTAGGATISITDSQGTTTANIANGQNGSPGADGYSPSASVSKVGDTATITITDQNGTTTASVSDGTNGTNGSDGFSPSASVSKVGNTATISITDLNGTTTASVSDGTNGTNGITPSITASASVDSNTGTPAVTVTKSGTDANPNFAFAFSNLKGADGVTPDTSVTTYSLTNLPAHSGGTNGYFIRKQLSVVTMNIDVIWMNSVTANSWTSIGTLPSAILPTATFTFPCVFTNGSNGQVFASGKVNVQTNGNIRFQSPTALNGLSAISFSASWII